MLSRYGERWSSARKLEHFERISAAALHMKEMLEELLLIGRAEVGALEAVPVPLDLQEFCRELIDALCRSVASAPGEPLSQRPPRVCFSLRGRRDVCLDPRLLTHVLGNLLENALKYSPAGSEVGLHVQVEAAGVRCVVQDCGVGIADDELPHLFESFWRGKNVGSVPGTGLGLSVAKRALDVQRGQLEVRSEPGLGTEFVVWLPLSGSPLSGSPLRVPATASTREPAGHGERLAPCSS
jgi:signal transduction histidine kinase